MTKSEGNMVALRPLVTLGDITLAAAAKVRRRDFGSAFALVTRPPFTWRLKNKKILNVS